jgi:Rieske Fe-S protein
VKNTRREFLTGLTKVAGGAVLGYVSLPLLVSCEPTSVPLVPEQTSTPIGPDGTISADISLLTQASPALVVPNFIAPDGFNVMVTLTKDGTIHAFSMRCTHLSCQVDNALANGEIHCSCHGSTYFLNGIVDVAQVSGQAPLTAYTVTPDATNHNIVHVKIQ